MRRTNWRPLFWSAATLLVVYLGTATVVKRYRAPGSTTVIEAQSMDMSEMSASTPAGSLPVATCAAEWTRFAPAVTYTGSVVALNDIDVFPRVTGTLVSVLVYPGDHVHAGQLIAQLDSAELASRAEEAAAERTVMEHDVTVASEEQQMAAQQLRSTGAKTLAARGAVTQAESQLTLAQAARDEAMRNQEAAAGTLADAKANAATARSDAAYWKAEINREEMLYHARAVSRDEFEKESAEAKSAEARLSQAEAGIVEKTAMLGAAASRIRQADASITAARAQLQQAQATLQGAEADADAAHTSQAASAHKVMHHRALVALSEAQERTADIVKGYTEIRAERDGVVTERLVSPGTLVQPGMPILRIKTDSRVRLQANVAETDLTGIGVGSEVDVTAPSDPKFHLHTRISALFHAANLQTRTVIAEAIVPNASGTLIPGQYVSMSIATASPRPELTVPLEAIQRDVNQKPFVWTAADAPAPTGKTHYTCLMHPQIDVDHPGKCPICSMTLVPRHTSGKYVAHRVYVALGGNDGANAVVERGLKPRQQVIYRGQQELNEGDSVTPTPWSISGPASLPMAGASGMAGMSIPGSKMPAGEKPPSSPAMPDMPGMGR